MDVWDTKYNELYSFDEETAAQDPLEAGQNQLLVDSTNEQLATNAHENAQRDVMSQQASTKGLKHELTELKREKQVIASATDTPNATNRTITMTNYYYRHKQVYW